MDDEGFLECTQALPDDWDADSDGEPNEQPELVAWLLVDDTKYEVYEGETKIGRDSASCAIVLPQKVLSKVHAALEVTSGVHTLVDLESMNKTRIGKMALKPHIRYALQGGESIRFGDVLAKYIIKSKAPCEDSGSETGSESMLQLEDPEDRTSPVLTHEHPGVGASNQVTSEPGTSKNSPEHTLNESAFVPETQEDKKDLSGIEFSPSGFHRTFIPESPSTSQSTPLQGRKASSVLETPGSVSVIKDVTSDNDSFFFESSQPKNKALKEKLNKSTENKGEVDYNSDASTDVDEDIATQLFDDSVDDVTSTAKKSYTTKKDKYDEDLCFQPTQLFTGTHHQTGKDNADDTQDVLDAFDDTIEKQSLSTSRDEDDDYVPTQLFFDDESDCVFKKPATLAPKSKKRISGGQKASKVDDDLFEEYLLAPTQPYGECSKSKQTDEDDIYDVPTQLFSADKVGEIKIKDREDMKKSASNRDSGDIDNMSRQPTKLFSSGIAGKDSSNNNDNICNQPTQPFMDEKDRDIDFFDAPTQVFEEESLDSKKKPGYKLVQESGKNRLEVMKTTVHCSDKDEAPKERLAGDEENADEEDLLPTQPFDTAKSSKESLILVDSDDDDLLATQLFDPSEKSVKVSRSDDEDGKKSRIRSAVFQTPSKVNDVSDEELTPTQIFNPHKSATKAQKRLVDNDDGLPPTQVFEGHYASKKTIESVDDGKFAPAQCFNCSESALKTPKSTMLNDSLPPTQLYSTVSTVDNAEKAATSPELPATQLYSDCNLSSDSPKPVLNRASTKPFTTEEKTCKSSVDVDDGGHLPTQPFADSNKNLSLNMQSTDKTTNLLSKDEIITEAPTQPYINVSSVESSCTQKGLNIAESLKLQATEKGHVENIDEDATQDISFDGFIGVDNTRVPEQSLGKMMERKDIACDHASDADSDTSETLLNDDTLNDEDNTKNSKLELTKVEKSNLLVCDEKNKKKLSNIENYHSDESTDVEDEPSTVKNLNEDGEQCSVAKLTHDGGILSEDSSHVGKLSVGKKESSSTAKLVDNIEPNMNIQNVSSKQSISTVASTLQEDVMQNSNETEEMLALDVCLVDSQDETQVNESSVFKNISDLDVKSGRSKETSFPLSSDSDSEEDSFNVSQKIFDLTPNENVNTPSSACTGEEASSVAVLSKAKRKLAYSKEGSKNIHNYSDIEESPNKKRCNRAAKKNENKLEKQRITRSRLNTKKIVGISVLDNEMCPIDDKRLPDKQQFSNMQITTDKPGSDNGEDKTLKISCRQTRKRTQGSLELLTNNSKRDESRCKSPKLEAPKMELDRKFSKRLKSCDLEKNYTNQVPSRKLPTHSPGRNVKQEEEFGRQGQVPDYATMQSNSSTDACREVTVDDDQEAQQSNTSCKYSTSNNQNNQQLASKSERRNTRRRTVNPVSENQKELSSEKQKPENKTVKRIESNREISQEQKEISGVRRSRGRKSRVMPSEVEVQNNKDFVEGKIDVRSSEKTECASEKPTVLQNNIGLIKKVKGSSTKHSSDSKYRAKKPVISASSVAGSDVLNSNRNVDKIDLELKDEPINTSKTRSSLLVSKESLERRLTLTEDKLMNEKSDSAYECHANKIATRGRKSALKEAGPSNEDENKATSENLSKVRTSKRARREPNRFSPEPDSQNSLCKKEENEILKETNSGYQNSDDERNRKMVVGDNENEHSKTSEDFSVPALRRGGRIKKNQDGIDSKVKIVKENVIEQPRNHSEIRRGRASIATSQPSSVKSYPKTRSRFSVLPGNIGSTRKQEGNTNSKVLQIEDKQKLPSAISKRGTNKDYKGETSDSGKGETSSHILESEDTQCFLKKKRKEKLSNIDQGDSEDHSERRGMSTDCSEIDSEDSQGSVKRKGRKATEKLPSTPKCGKQEFSVSNKILWSPSQRQLQASNRPRVLFTGYKDAQDEKIVLDLGGKVVESAQECTVLVTTAIKRTCKLLAVMGKGMPIVSPSWLSASKQARNFIDPWEFLVKDRESEVKFGFRLEQSLRSASKYQLFEGLEIHATKSVKPPPEQMKEIIECSGGQYLDMPPKRYAPQIRVVSCPEDKGQWTTFRRVGIPILGTEFILTGLLRHQLLLDEFVLT